MPLSAQEVSLLTSVYGLSKARAQALASVCNAIEAGSGAPETLPVAAQNAVRDLGGVFTSREANRLLTAINNALAGTPAASRDKDVVAFLLRRMAIRSYLHEPDLLEALYAEPEEPTACAYPLDDDGTVAALFSVAHMGPAVGAGDQGVSYTSLASGLAVLLPANTFSTARFDRPESGTMLVEYQGTTTGSAVAGAVVVITTAAGVLVNAGVVYDNEDYAVLSLLVNADGTVTALKDGEAAAVGWLIVEGATTVGASDKVAFGIVANFSAADEVVTGSLFTDAAYYGTTHGEGATDPCGNETYDHYYLDDDGSFATETSVPDGAPYRIGYVHQTVEIVANQTLNQATTILDYATEGGVVLGASTKVGFEVEILELPTFSDLGEGTVDAAISFGFANIVAGSHEVTVVEAIGVATDDSVTHAVAAFGGVTTLALASAAGAVIGVYLDATANAGDGTISCVLDGVELSEATATLAAWTAGGRVIPVIGFVASTSAGVTVSGKLRARVRTMAADIGGAGMPTDTVAIGDGVLI